MDERPITALAVVALVFLAGCTGGVASGGDAGPNEPNRTVEVTASGEATAEPDRATIHASVVAEGESADAVRTELAERDETFRAALAEYGLDEEDVRTERYYVRQTRESRKDRDRSAYVGEHRYAIELDDVDAVGEVVDVAVEGGADDINHITFGLSEERAAELREEALADAVENARADANVLAEQTGLSVTGVRTASTADADVRPYRASVAAEDAGDAATSIDAGDVSVTVRVRVVFEATDAE